MMQQLISSQSLRGHRADNGAYYSGKRAAFTQYGYEEVEQYVLPNQSLDAFVHDFMSDSRFVDGRTYHVFAPRGDGLMQEGHVTKDYKNIVLQFPAVVREGRSIPALTLDFTI